MGKTHMSGVQHTKCVCFQQQSTKTNWVPPNLCLIMFIQSFSYLRTSLFKKRVNSSWMIDFYSPCIMSHFLPFFLKWPIGGSVKVKGSLGQTFHSLCIHLYRCYFSFYMYMLYIYFNSLLGSLEQNMLFGTPILKFSPIKGIIKHNISLDVIYRRNSWILI